MVSKKEIDTKKLIDEFNENKKYWTDKKRKSETGNDFVDFLMSKELIKYKGGKY